jgi:DNA-binding CsgD family transcriptional regulator/pimeloyl-ACP methyl ester carboxylesterase
MNEPAVHYVRTQDGVSIAYSVQGSGIPLVFMPLTVSHIRLMWRSKSVGPLLNQLSQRFRLIQYDPRERGMSQRDLPGHVKSGNSELDLAAVVDALGLDRFLVFASHGSTHVAIRYALEYPERVIGLMLWHLAGNFRGGEVRRLGELARDDWERCVVTLAQSFLPNEDIHTGVDLVQAACDQAAIIKLMTLEQESTVDDIWAQVRTPTLLLYKDLHGFATGLWSERAAATIPSSRLVLLEDDGTLYSLPRDCSILVSHISEFVRSLGIASPDADDVRPILRKLTQRELEVLRLVAAGRTNKEIAALLVLSERTIARHITNIYRKIETRSKAEATAFAIRAGLD